MPVIQNLMKRMGFVKLSRFGLVLTPDGRILSMRPSVLDDGIGGRIVGWEDGDLAAAELQKWEPARPAPAQAVAPRLAMPPPLPVRTTQPAPVVAKPAPTPAPPVVIVPVAPPVVKPAPASVAPEPVEVEDDWEWTIAIARARAAAEEADDAARTLARPAPLPVSSMSGEWPRTEPLGSIDYEDYSTVHRVVKIPPREEKTVVAIPPRAASPATVIPVPKLPNAHTIPRDITLRPVVRTAPPAPPRRMPKGTSPSVDTQVTKVMEDTLTNVAAIGDRTKPGISIPRAAATVALPHVKRTASR